MKTNRAFGAALLFFMLSVPLAFPLTAVKDSSEDLFWTDPMTVHDYKKNSDFHNVAVSTMALTELEFVRLGDGLLNLSTRNKKNPISKSLDSLEYAYSRLPRVQPVRRFGQFWDALQLRELSLSDARLVGSVLLGDGMGGITPLMQVRAYKLVVWVEDVIYDLDRTVMSPLNWGVASLSGRPSNIKSLGYAADGLGVLRWELSSGLKYASREIVRFSSKVVTGLEKPHDIMIRRKRKKAHQRVLIYSKMPLSVFQEYRSYFTGKNRAVFVGTLADWYDRVFHNPELLPEDIRKKGVRVAETLLLPNSPQDAIVATEYRSWEKTPSELRKYVITAEELTDLIQQYVPPAASQRS